MVFFLFSTLHLPRTTMKALLWAMKGSVSPSRPPPVGSNHISPCHQVGDTLLNGFWFKRYSNKHSGVFVLLLTSYALA